MSTPSEAMGGDISKGLIGGKRIAIIFFAVLTLMIAWRVYQQLFAWDMGMDSFEPEFQTYWMNLLYGQWILEFVLAAVIWGYLLKTRDKDVFNITPQEELKRTFTLLAWLFCYVWIVYWAASFFAEQDASWHQVTVRDTDFTPSHIVLFYGTMPAYILAGVGSFLYARTRLPSSFISSVTSTSPSSCVSVIIRSTIWINKPPNPNAVQPNTTKPQCNGAVNSSSMNQNV